VEAAAVVGAAVAAVVSAEVTVSAAPAVLAPVGPLDRAGTEEQAAVAAWGEQVEPVD
jgi:hypothetical protein